ncbi:hypothetical protein D3C73_1608400 [compost metagenome]
MADMNAAIAQNPPFLLIKPDAVSQNEPLVRQTDMIEVHDIAHAGHRLHNLDLTQILGRVSMHIDPIACRQITDLLQQRLGA